MVFITAIRSKLNRNQYQGWGVATKDPTILHSRSAWNNGLEKVSMAQCLMSFCCESLEENDESSEDDGIQVCDIL